MSNKNILRFLTCGSVDDGKSTLIGRILYDTKSILKDQMNSVKNESKKFGTQENQIDLALLVDGLQSEREQGITIDVAYRFFSTNKRKFIIADTPGHEEYTRNMVTGASNSNLALILIDATKGVLPQTKRHTYIVNLLGIKNIIVAVNKMDLVNYNETIFKDIVKKFKEITLDLKLSNIKFVPISATKGDNIVYKSKQMFWYNGNTILNLLENIKIQHNYNNKLRFAVQYVNRPNSNFRGFCGTVLSGKISVGDTITILPSGNKTKVKKIIDASKINLNHVISKAEVSEATKSMAITLLTETEIDISRGDMIIHSKETPKISNQLKVMIVWMDNTPLNINKDYYIKHTTAVFNIKFEKINYKIDINNFKKITTDTLKLNDIGSCRVSLNRPIIVDTYKNNRLTGSFIIIDKLTNNTVGAGMIVDLSRRNTKIIKREYSNAEKELNAFIRKHYPEWDCKEI